MDSSGSHFSRKNKLAVILAVTSGNLLEWYEIYLFVYWAPTISHLFFSKGPEYNNLLHAFLLFFLGFLARPLGGIYFGRLGDKIGRKKALVISVLMMVIPTFLIGFLPTYNQIGYLATFFLAVLRILQSFPAGGEVPGAACYLYESSHYSERKYITSWTGVGIQVGILIATIECYLLDRFYSPEALLTWGWRFSFIIAGLIGVCGLLLRSYLHETPLFQEMHFHDKTIVPKSIFREIIKNKSGIIKSILYCFLVSPAFYFISINFTSYFDPSGNNLLITAGFLLLVTVPVPFFGKLTQIFELKKMIIFATLCVIALIFPMYYSISNEFKLVFFVVSVLFSLCIACITALTPYLVCNEFPTKFRFTGVALGYNFVDAIIGGITPAATLFLFQNTEDKGSFCWILLVCSVVSFISFFWIKEKHPLKGIR